MKKMNKAKKREQIRRLQTVVFSAVFVLCGGWSLFSADKKAEISIEDIRVEAKDRSIASAEKQSRKNPSENSTSENKRLNTLSSRAGGPPIDKSELFNGEMESGEINSEKNTEKNTEKNIEKSGRVNLNTASLEELDTLPGIGPATAGLIISYRESYGGFAAIEEIKNVKRIGDKTFEKLKDRICV